MKIIPKWHTYWVNPGDAGLATKIAWVLPDGFAAGPIIWPHPQRLPVGDLVNFGYENESLLITRMTAPPGIGAGQTVTLKAHVSWLVCEVECVPEQADLSVDVKVDSGAPRADARWAKTVRRHASRHAAIRRRLEFQRGSHGHRLSPHGDAEQGPDCGGRTASCSSSARMSRWSRTPPRNRSRSKVNASLRH